MRQAAENGEHEKGRSEEDRLLLLMKTGDQEAFRRLYELTAKGILPSRRSLRPPRSAGPYCADF